jgi:hypothetical protein
MNLKFWKKPVQWEQVTPEEAKPEEAKIDLFTCHYCNYRFEAKNIFSMPVKSTDGAYFFQGKGVQCPKCLKNSIYG